jgi:uncharacterized protein DUF2586
MPANGLVNITVQDTAGASVTVPLSTVQLVIGTSGAGTSQQIVSTRSVSTLQSSFTDGQLVQYGASVIQAGGTVLAIKVPPTTKGAATAVTHGGSGTSVVTTTLDATNGSWDDYLVEVLVITGGTIGVAGPQIQISLDATRLFGTTINLGTANTFAIQNTGITLNFAAGTLVAGDTYKFSTTAPVWADGDVQTALTTTYFGSMFASTGVGSMVVLGKTAGADGTAFEGYMDTLSANFNYDRLHVSARDLAIPTAWGGAGETEATWIGSIQADWSGVSARRLISNAGHYNMTSAVANPTVGVWRPRRNLLWAQALREVTIPPQRHSGRVRDGALGNIVLSPTTDPLDGFTYHDERLNPGLDGSRFCSAWTRIGQGLGYFIKNPNLMSPAGSFFTILPLGNVMDIACTIALQVGAQYINDDVRTNVNGTIYINDAFTIQNAIQTALFQNMTAVGMISSSNVVVDQTNNVQTQKQVNITVTITSRGYILGENITIGFSA